MSLTISQKNIELFLEDILYINPHYDFMNVKNISCGEIFFNYQKDSLTSIVSEITVKGLLRDNKEIVKKFKVGIQINNFEIDFPLDYLDGIYTLYVSTHAVDNFISRAYEIENNKSTNFCNSISDSLYKFEYTEIDHSLKSKYIKEIEFIVIEV